MTKHVRFITLGCRVNQYETQAMRESLESIGVQDGVDSGRTQESRRDKMKDIDYVVINTCTVTHAADRENKYWIRRARREHPDAKIVVTGCMVEKNRKEIESIPEVDLVLSNYEKAEISERLMRGCASSDVQDEVLERKRKREFTPLSISRTQGKSRAFMKIQDGCDHACSFCKVVMVRGRSRSRELQGVIDEAKRLRDAGYREIVFAGIQLGAYGDDFNKTDELSRVLEACHEIEGIERLRLSSIEPTDISDHLIQTMSDLPKCCPQLHIPLQSGDNEVLKGMNRRYERDFYSELILKLKSKMSDFTLTLDVMVGFPGEEESNFQQTVDLLESIKPLRCHVFPYSNREGTRAAQFKDLPPQVIKDRVKRLMALSDHWGRIVRTPYVGKTLPVLVEKEMGKGRLLHGLTANYLKVCFQGDEDLVGQIVPVQLLDLEEEVFLGKRVMS